MAWKKVVTTGDNLSVMASTTSDQLAGIISNETGTAKLVFNTSPTLITPVLGTPSSGTLTNCTLPAAQVTAGTMASGMTLVAPALGTPASGTLTNCTFPIANINTATVPDDYVTLAKMAGGTDGNLISYDASGDPVAVATGSDGQVLTSTGAGSPPVFEDANAGDITGIDAGALIDVADGSTATPEISVDLSELTDGTADVVGSADELVYLDAGSQKRKQIDEIKLGQFNNDQGWTSSSGDITGVTIITDTGILSAMSDTGGSADFSILGSSGVGVTNSGNTATIVAVAGEIGITSLSGYTAAAYANISSVGGGSIVTTGALDSGSITSGFGAIDNGSSSITTTGTIYAGNMQISGTLQHTNTEQLNVEDSTILLNSGYSGSSAIDAGIFVERDTTAAVGYVSAERNPALYWDESVGFWGLGQDTDTGTDVTPNGYIAMATSSTSADNGTASPIGSIHIDTDGPDIWIRTA